LNLLLGEPLHNEARLYYNLEYIFTWLVPLSALSYKVLVSRFIGFNGSTYTYPDIFIVGFIPLFPLNAKSVTWHITLFISYVTGKFDEVEETWGHKKCMQ
jgi:hypothetical protein